MGLGMDMNRHVMSYSKIAQLSSLARLVGRLLSVIAGAAIERDAIVERLEAKRKAVGNMIHKGVLRDAAEFVRKGQQKPGAVAGLF